MPYLTGFTATLHCDSRTRVSCDTSYIAFDAILPFCLSRNATRESEKRYRGIQVSRGQSVAWQRENELLHSFFGEERRPDSRKRRKSRAYLENEVHGWKRIEGLGLKLEYCILVSMPRAARPLLVGWAWCTRKKWLCGHMI